MSRDSGDRGTSRRLSALVAAALAFLAGLAGAAAFFYFYWTDGGTAGMGVSLALAMAGMGAGLVVWSHGLMPDEEVSSKREPLPSSDEEKEQFRESFVSGEHRIGRRRLLGLLAGGVMGLLALDSVSLLRSMGKSPLPVLYQTAWTKGARLVTFDGRPVTAAVQPGDILTVFPEGETDSITSQTLLLRVDEAKLRLPPGRESWTPMGFIAFSKICTHAGCPVAQYEKNVNILLCPCHQSSFDILRGAVPVGGPAGRPLPQLPLYVDQQGFLRARGDFSSHPGPGFWSLRS